LLQEN